MGFYKILASSYRLTNIFSSKNFRKILIFLAIGLVLFLLFSNNSFAVEDVSVTTVDGLTIRSDRNYFTPSSSATGLGYLELEKGYIYTVTYLSGSSKNIALSENLPSEYGVYTFLTSLNSTNNSYSIVGDGRYIYCDIYVSDGVSITREPLTGFHNTTNALIYELSVNNLWSQFNFAVPLIGIGVLFALGFGIVKKLNKGESKSKVKF